MREKLNIYPSGNFHGRFVDLRLAQLFRQVRRLVTDRFQQRLALIEESPVARRHETQLIRCGIFLRPDPRAVQKEKIFRLKMARQLHTTNRKNVYLR